MQIPSTKVLRRMVALSEQHDDLLERAANLELEIQALWDGIGPPGEIQRKSKLGRGKMGNLILGVIAQSGDSGAAVKDIAAKLKMKPQKVHAWLNMTGKRNRLVEAVSRGVYRLSKASRRKALLSKLGAR